ncbi:PREDICTED: nicotinamide phosphoribosyltransferase-like [Amphimedon queenslandica]|uniref:Nicotinamide phosphoribosyltransferase n=1 Tax=Amphimedon queenslandica TaxID=400682 RepID=A0AAN0IBS3_AMPQE|nr:PREDICTED: nicotinamide phosphoribosyltransferase-like [Amphimedon queenslandica]|eukprot:XP_003384858.1 PREDICTED: nicotinamide phosphoribosyltransferase-like [Amphimedon queenslandica]
MAGSPCNPCYDNFILTTDSYKNTHYLQYPPGTTTVYSYFESRGGKHPQTVFFGLQYILKRYFLGKVVTLEKIEQAKAIFDVHVGPNIFNYEGWKYILEKYDGHLPLRIKAVPEGTVMPTKNVLFTVENTDPKCYWLTNFVEAVLVQTWYPMTVCSSSRAQKEVLVKYLDETADNLDSLPFKLNDFGFRGSTSVESSSIGGVAHLVNFQGTDTLSALVMAREYYGCEMAGFSIPAAEHSTITSWTKDGEADAFRNMLAKFPKGIVSCVCDSYDLWNACEHIWGEELKELVELRGNSGAGIVVLRPDSGDPPTILLRVLEILGSKFGTVTNSKGYKLLPPYLRVIQADSVSYDSLITILEHLKKNMWSADNLIFGSGGGLIQRVDRDTQKCAYKCSYAVINGKGVNVYKSPITDLGKKSKRGSLTLEMENEQFLTKEEGKGSPDKDLLVTVYENGHLLKDYSLSEIRERAEIPLVREKNSKK